MLNQLAINGIIIAVLSFISAGFFLFHKPHLNAKIFWGWMSLCAGLWGGILFFSMIEINEPKALFLARLLNYTAIFIPVFYFHFVALLTEQNNIKRQLGLIYFFIICYFIVCLVNPELFVKTVSAKRSYRFYSDAGPLYFIFVFEYCALLIWSIWMLINSIRGSELNKRTQLIYVLIGGVFGFLGGATTFPLLYDINIEPYGVFLIPIYVVMIAIAIMKYNLLNINIIISKSLGYSITITFFR